MGRSAFRPGPLWLVAGAGMMLVSGCGGGSAPVGPEGIALAPFPIRGANYAAWWEDPYSSLQSDTALRDPRTTGAGSGSVVLPEYMDSRVIRRVWPSR